MTISGAIAALHLLAFDYENHPRIVEPHAYGVDRQGRRALLAYQVRGGSNSGDGFGWKVFHEGKILGLRVLEQTFPGARPGYKRGSKPFRLIAAQL